MSTVRTSKTSFATGHLTIVPLCSAAGAECVGVDLKYVDADAWQAMLGAYHKHSLLVVRGQDLPKTEQISFSRRFGALELPIRKDYLGLDFPELHVVSNAGADGKPKATGYLENPGNFFWHTDASYMKVPASTTLLYAIQVPEVGGDTCFANMHAAYEALPENMKTCLAHLRAIHSWEQSRYNSGSRPASNEEKMQAPPVSHPIVRTHPATGRKALYLGIHISHIEGMDLASGRNLLRELIERATQPQFIYRHKWQAGDLVIWDNRSLLHKASDDFDMNTCIRILHRTVVQGSVPV